MINASETHEIGKCAICVEAMFTNKPFKHVTTRCSKLLELVHTDLANLKNTASRGGKNYYITFIDDFLGILKFIF